MLQFELNLHLGVEKKLIWFIHQLFRALNAIVHKFAVHPVARTVYFGWICISPLFFIPLVEMHRDKGWLLHRNQPIRTKTCCLLTSWVRHKRKIYWPKFQGLFSKMQKVKKRVEDKLGCTWKWIGNRKDQLCLRLHCYLLPKTHYSWKCQFSLTAMLTDTTRIKPFSTYICTV